MSKPAWVLALAIAALPCLQGGAASRPKAEPRPSSAEAPARGEQIVLAMRTEAATLLEPFCTTEDEINLAGLLFPTLLDITFRGELEHGPYLAESWEVAPDGLAITFLLKKASWDDGKPITAQDVVATYRIVGDERFPSVKSEYLARIAGVEALDERRVRFRFKSRYYLQNQLADANIGILPAHVYGDLEPGGVRGTEKALVPVGHGPFRVVSHEGGRRFVLERNDRCATQPVPYLKRVVFQFTGDYEARKNALLTGEVDAADGIRSDDLEAILKKGGLRAISRGLRNVDFVTWNTKKAPFDSAELRRAITLAIDRDGMNKALFRVPVGGAVAPCFGTVPPVVETAYPFDLSPLPFDAAESERILDRLGWRRPTKGKTREKGGVPLAFTLLVNSETPRRVQTARMIQQDLAKVGVVARLEQVPFSSLQTRVPARDYEAAIYGFTASLQLKMGDVWGSKAMFNLSGYENPRVEERIVGMREEVDPKKTREGMMEIQKLVHADQPFTFLCWFAQYSLVSDRIRDFGADVLSFTNNLNRCYVPLSQQKQFVGE